MTQTHHDRHTDADATQGGALGLFGHHPEIDFDFCVEIDVLTGYAYDVRVGANFSPDWRARSQWEFWGRLSRALRFARKQVDSLDPQSRGAIPLLRSLEGYALHQDDLPITALLALALTTRREPSDAGWVQDGETA